MWYIRGRSQSFAESTSSSSWNLLWYKHLGLGSTPNQTALMVMAASCIHTHTDKRSKTQLSQYARAQAGSSLIRRHRLLTKKVWLFFVSQLFNSANNRGWNIPRAKHSLESNLSWECFSGSVTFIIWICRPAQTSTSGTQEKLRPKTTAAKWHCGRSTVHWNWIRMSHFNSWNKIKCQRSSKKWITCNYWENWDPRS